MSCSNKWLNKKKIRVLRRKGHVSSLLKDTKKQFRGSRTGPVAAGPPWGSARELSLSPLTRRGDPPPSWPRGGWRHHAIFLEYSWFYCGVTATGNGWF